MMRYGRPSRPIRRDGHQIIVINFHLINVLYMTFCLMIVRENLVTGILGIHKKKILIPDFLGKKLKLRNLQIAGKCFRNFQLKKKSLFKRVLSNGIAYPIFNKFQIQLIRQLLEAKWIFKFRKEVKIVDLIFFKNNSSW